MKEKGLNNMLLTGGGIIPQEEMDQLMSMGSGKLFGPGTPTSEPIDYIKDWVSDRDKKE
jgi:methylmalonyl-CoA mutase C-terminal domain/subunit